MKAITNTHQRLVFRILHGGNDVNAKDSSEKIKAESSDQVRYLSTRLTFMMNVECQVRYLSTRLTFMMNVECQIRYLSTRLTFMMNVECQHSHRSREGYDCDCDSVVKPCINTSIITHYCPIFHNDFGDNGMSESNATITFVISGASAVRPKNIEYGCSAFTMATFHVHLIPQNGLTSA
jgi:hypothetical protein